MICNESEIIKALKAGEVVGIPTDTVYGFAVLNEFSDKVYALKKRPKHKKLISFVPSVSFVGEVDDLSNEDVCAFASKYWPGPNTLIFNKGGELTSFRIPNEKNVLSLLDNLGSIILTTSANISGEDTCLSKEDFEKTFPDIKLLEERYVSQKQNQASNIYVITCEGVKKIR